MSEPVEPGQHRVVRIHGYAIVVRVLRRSVYRGCWFCRSITGGGFHILREQHLLSLDLFTDVNEAIRACRTFNSARDTAQRGGA